MDFENFEKLLKFGTDYLSDYFRVFIATLRHPIIRFQPLSTSGGGLRLNPKLWSFVLISILFGSTFNAFIPGRRAGPDFVTTVVVLITCWFFYSYFTHLVCLLLCGRGKLLDTLSVSLQLLSVLYVVSSFVAFMWGALMVVPQLGISIASLGSAAVSLANNPVIMYFLVQFGLLAVYLPIAVKHVHSFGWLRQIAVGMLASPITLYSFVIYLKYRVMLRL